MKSILDYINYMRLPNKWSGNLEMIATYKLYNINMMMVYNIYDQHNILLYYKYCYKYTIDDKKDKDLCIITNIANSHYKLLFSKKHKIAKINDKLKFNYIILAENDELCKVNKNLNFYKNNKNNIVNINEQNLSNNIRCKNNNLSNNKYKENNLKNSYKNSNDSEILEKNNNIYNNDNIYNIDIELIDIRYWEYDKIIKKYSDIDKIVKYSDIYAYLLSKKNENRIWPKHIEKIENKKNKKKIVKKHLNVHAKNFLLTFL